MMLHKFTPQRSSQAKPSAHLIVDDLCFLDLSIDKHAFKYEKTVHISFIPKEQQLEMSAASRNICPHVVMMIKKPDFYAFNSKDNLDRNVNKCSMIQKHRKMPRNIPSVD